MLVARHESALFDLCHPDRVAPSYLVGAVHRARTSMRR